MNLSTTTPPNDAPWTPEEIRLVRRLNESSGTPLSQNELYDLERLFALRIMGWRFETKRTGTYGNGRPILWSYYCLPDGPAGDNHTPEEREGKHYGTFNELPSFCTDYAQIPYILEYLDKRRSLESTFGVSISFRNHMLASVVVNFSGSEGEATGYLPQALVMALVRAHFADLEQSGALDLSLLNAVDTEFAGVNKALTTGSEWDGSG